MGDDSIDAVISHIDMGYLVTLHSLPHVSTMIVPPQSTRLDTLSTRGSLYQLSKA